MYSKKQLSRLGKSIKFVIFLVHPNNVNFKRNKLGGKQYTQKEYTNKILWNAVVFLICIHHSIGKQV